MRAPGSCRVASWSIRYQLTPLSPNNPVIIGFDPNPSPRRSNGDLRPFWKPNIQIGRQAPGSRIHFERGCEPGVPRALVHYSACVTRSLWTVVPSALRAPAKV